MPGRIGMWLAEWFLDLGSTARSTMALVSCHQPYYLHLLTMTCRMSAGSVVSLIFSWDLDSLRDAQMTASRAFTIWSLLTTFSSTAQSYIRQRPLNAWAGHVHCFASLHTTLDEKHTCNHVRNYVSSGEPLCKNDQFNFPFISACHERLSHPSSIVPSESTASLTSTWFSLKISSILVW
jgi:hypothetical protein